MDLLTQPKVLARAALAGLLTTAACAPFAATSPRNLFPAWLWVPMLMLCVFLMWAFVFAWHFVYSGRPVVLAPFRPRLWLAATGYGIAVSLLVHWLLDPAIRQIAPHQYPTTLEGCIAAGLFQLGIGPLCICFAPFAFFIRMTRRQTVATALTVLWAVFVEYSALRSQPHLPPFTITASLMLRSVLSGFVGVYFFLNGGILLVWWISFLIELRLLLELAH